MNDSAPQKNALAIRLTEPVIFLKAEDVFHHRRRATQNDSGQPSILRGLLTLTLIKPTRISSIEIELQGRSNCAWPDGIGPRRLEVVEEHKLFSASTVFFRADSSTHGRRSASAGPHIAAQDALTWPDSGNTAADHQHDSWHIAPPISSSANGSRPRPRSFSSEGTTMQPTIVSRREENHMLGASPLSHQFTSSEFSISTSSHSSHSSPVQDERDETLPSQGSQSNGVLHESRAQGIPSTQHRCFASLRASLASAIVLPPKAGGVESTNNLEDSPFTSNATPRQRRPSSPPAYSASPAATTRDVPQQVTQTQPEPVPVSSDPPESQPDSLRGRSLLSVAALWSAFKDGCSHSGHFQGEKREGRPLDSDEPQLNGKEVNHERSVKSTLGKLVHLPWLDKDVSKEPGVGWKEFKEGVYNYPISFSVPGNAPPSLNCAYGQVVWRLKAQVHRPGAFISRLCATREVTLISSPREEEMEETETIVVERVWESHLHYRISISGRIFPIGGFIPIQFTIMPLDKVKIFRISGYLEERVDYYTVMHRLARTEPLNRMLLFSFQYCSRDEENVLLPLSTSLDKSPLRLLVRPEDDAAEMAATFMGPGPWSFQRDVKLPDSCSELHFTYRGPAGNIAVSHTLKIAMRVQKVDDVDTKAKKRTFDIVIQTPVHILPCRFNKDWTTLPHYSENLGDISTGQSCPCVHKRRAYLRGNSDPEYGTRPNPTTMQRLTLLRDSLTAQNAQFERLMSGQESEVGEAPPSYDTVIAAR